ncbi:MAG TPA: BON domain-containing protein [Rhodanobacteraceae bacterium]|jgi:hyperosmotically inducible protein|nr:BON domain-containing protein [Rhodanobacteraceae bacterium]
MKTERIAIAIGSLLIASAGATAYAQQTPQQTPQQMPPSASTAYMSGASHANRPMSNDMSNSSITRQVKQELTSHGVTATNVDVSFENGTATLTGTVATQGDIGKARSAALRVKGVKHVDTSGLHARAQANDQGGR